MLASSTGAAPAAAASSGVHQEPRMKLGTISTVSTAGAAVVVIVDGSFQRGSKINTAGTLLTVRSVI
ncbi:hypothetical protein SRABI128_04791 [Microbacterium sp. Bi128]|nr:hypothetical protein SRABI128_04791 [Microbacterium sp. Bi128]